MTLASETRDAVRKRSFLREALRAGVLNYSAAARFLDVGEDDEEAVVAALRRYAEELPEYAEADRSARVTMESGLEPGPPADALVVVGDTALVAGTGSSTGVQATGDVDPTTLGHVLQRLTDADVAVEAAAATDGYLLVVVGRRDGADTVRLLEDALETVPTSP